MVFTATWMMTSLESDAVPPTSQVKETGAVTAVTLPARRLLVVDEKLNGAIVASKSTVISKARVLPMSKVLKLGCVALAR